MERTTRGNEIRSEEGLSPLDRLMIDIGTTLEESKAYLASSQPMGGVKSFCMLQETNLYAMVSEPKQQGEWRISLLLSENTNELVGTKPVVMILGSDVSTDHWKGARRSRFGCKYTVPNRHEKTQCAMKITILKTLAIHTKTNPERDRRKMHNTCGTFRMAQQGPDKKAQTRRERSCQAIGLESL